MPINLSNCTGFDAANLIGTTLPVLNASSLTDLNGSAINSGTVGAAYLDLSTVVDLVSDQTITGVKILSNGVVIGDSNNLTWGGAYGAEIPTIAGTASVGIAFYPTGSTSGEIARFTASGLGIGTTSPSQKLEVNGNTLVSGYVVSNNGNSDTPFGVGGTGVSTGVNFVNSNGYWLLRSGSDNSLNIDTYNSNSPICALTIKQNGNVGIGTTSPATKLHIEGADASDLLTISTTLSTADSTSGIVFRNTASGGTVYTTPSAKIDTGIGASGLTPWLAFHTSDNTQGGTLIERLRIDNAGNVGIGTLSPIAKLNVIGASGTPSLTTNAEAVAFETNSGSRLSIGAFNGGTYYQWIQTKDNSNSGTAYPLAINPLGGNVGIGTDSPRAKLDVQGGSVFTNTDYNIVVGSSYKFQATSSWIQLVSGYSIAWSANADSVTGTNDTFMNRSAANTLRISSDGDSGSANLIVNGNVGIGTTSPATKLHVSSSTSFDQLLVESTGETAPGIMMYSGASDAATRNWGFATTYVNYGDFGILQSNVKGGNPLAAGTTRFYIDKDGNVGIGTTSPSAQLHVVNSVDAQVALKVVGTAGQSANLVEFGPDGTPLVSIDYTGNVKVAGGLDMSSTAITALADPTNDQDATTKVWVVTNFAPVLVTAGNFQDATIEPSRLTYSTGGASLYTGDMASIIAAAGIGYNVVNGLIVTGP